MDCYTLFRDAYHLCGIDLPDFGRTNGWWLRGENLYLANMQVNGFYQVSMQDAQPGDVILVAGKGHEPYQDIKGVKHHFDDKEEVAKAFGTLRN
mgnify:CR=1 FL=1